jgi:hypothetical protein
MTTDAKTAEKRTAVDYLSFDENTAKRVEWEAFEFTVVGPQLVEVTNASYGFEKDEHSYTVGVAVEDGVAVPTECECPADIHGEQDCKHKAALALVGGSVVLESAHAFSPPTTTATCPNGDPYCDGPESDDLPCFDCFERDPLF